MDTARDLMTPNPIVVTPDATLSDCARLLLRHRVRHLPVIDGGEVLGVVTDFGVFRLGGMVTVQGDQWVIFDDSAKNTTVRDLILPVTVVVPPDRPLTATLRDLAETKQDVALIIEEGRLLGIITEHDGVRLGADVIPLSVGIVHEASTPVLTATPDTSGIDALARMIENRIRHLVIADEDHVVCGVVAYRDLVADDVRSHRDWTVLDAVPKTGIHTLPATATLRAAARKMAANKIGCLPVIEHGNSLIGVVTRTDILEATVAALQDENAFNSKNH